MRTCLLTLIMILTAALIAGPVMAQGNTSQTAKDRPAGLMNLPAVKSSDAKARSNVFQLPKDKPIGPANLPAKTVQPAKPSNQKPATYVGKVSEKISPERKACRDKCTSGQTSCEKRCAGMKERFEKANCSYSCSTTLAACQKRCPAK